MGSDSTTTLWQLPDGNADLRDEAAVGVWFREEKLWDYSQALQQQLWPVGMRHVLNVCRQLSLAPWDEGLRTRAYGLVKQLADRKATLDEKQQLVGAVWGPGVV
jgi:hypothetical protein